MQNEIWKDAPGFPGYQVSNAGRVRSFERILVPDNVKGYYRVRLYRKGRVSRVYIHRLVASAFVPNPAGLPQINHKNEIKTDNRPDNLEWCTAQYNNTYGTARIRAAKAKSKAVGQYTPDGILIAKYERIKDARDRFPVKNNEMNFEYFKIVCEELAKSIGCTFKFNNYPQFGWFGGSFEVDAFGGIAAIVKFYNGVWSNNDFAFGSLSEALANVPKQVKEMAAARADVDFFQNYD